MRVHSEPGRCRAGGDWFPSWEVSSWGGHHCGVAERLPPGASAVCSRDFTAMLQGARAAAIGRRGSRLHVESV